MIAFASLVFDYISSKGKTTENVVLLMNGAGDGVTEDTEEDEMLDVCFVSVFIGKTS